MSMTTSRCTALLVTALLVAVLLAAGLAGCSSSGGSEDSAAIADDTTTTSGAPFDIAAFEPTGEQCATLDSSPSDEADVEARAALFPVGLQDDISEYIGGLLAHITSADPDTGEPTVPPPVASETMQTLMVTCTSSLGATDGVEGSTEEG